MEITRVNKNGMAYALLPLRLADINNESEANMKSGKWKLTSAAIALFLTACGSSGGSDMTSEETRPVNGSLSGNVGSVKSVEAVRVSDGARFAADVSSNSSAKMTALTSTAPSNSFTLSLPVNASYTLNIVAADNTLLASLQFAANSAGTATTNTFTVSPNPAPSATTGSTATTAIDLGNITVPATTSATTTGTTTSSTAVAVVTPQFNPLSQDDEDDDGVADLDDDDYMATGVTSSTTGGSSSSSGSMDDDDDSVSDDPDDDSAGDDPDSDDPDDDDDQDADEDSSPAGQSASSPANGGSHDD